MRGGGMHSAVSAKCSIVGITVRVVVWQRISGEGNNFLTNSQNVSVEIRQ